MSQDTPGPGHTSSSPRGDLATVEVDFAERSYAIQVDSGGPEGVGAALVAQLGTREVAVLTDEIVGPLYAGPVLDSLRQRGCRVERLTLGVGEHHKVAQSAERAWSWLLNQGFDRRVVILALGGGIVGDLAGFVASTWMRGVDLVAVPTTLLAQVDSSVGGKTGFNLAGAKNIVGTFHQPRLVWAGLGALTTLEARDYRAGLAEVVKHGVLAGATAQTDILELLETERAAVNERDPAVVGRLVAACCEVKRDVVQADEREAGQRQLLNFGHTFGHAIETVTGHRFRHGEAVALGMVAELRLAERLGVCGPELRERLVPILEGVGLPADDGPWWTSEVATAMRADKKRRGSTINVTMVEALGRVRMRAIPTAELESMVAST